eukprot:PhM_4_TR2816/c0_g1_i1/m.94162/K14802/DRS2, ATP8A; phospholipid-transporting ATPase
MMMAANEGTVPPSNQPTAAQQQQRPQPAAAPTPRAAEEAEEQPILIHMNNPEANAPYNYPSNFISTSKYTLLTFVPLNLYEQFRKVSNFYFLINMIIALIPGVSPVSPLTAVMPLLFVLGVAACKDGFEDYVRHQSDDKANSQPAHVLRNGRLVDIPSSEVVCGDIIKVNKGEEFRADILLLASNVDEGVAYIETCNLDGETNIKSKKAVPATWELDDPDPLSANTAQLAVRCMPPSPALLSWNGVLIMSGEEHAVGLDQFLYRSAVLRNTEHIWGIVLYAGVDTKMFRNLQQKPPKFSALDKKLNQLILGVLVVQQLVLFAICGYAVEFNKTHDDHWYIEHYIDDDYSPHIALFFMRYLTYFILMSYMIPISLFVTIELCKVSQASLMQWDHELMEFMDGKWHSCKANTSNLNEQLSQVKYIFTDKTGTLTENRMNFLRGDVLGHAIQLPCEPSSMPRTPEIDRYFKALALCHTIQPFPDKKNPGKFIYEGQSPDESALVSTAATFGYELTTRGTNIIVIVVHGEPLEYELLATLEFTAVRKMMSLILRDPTTSEIVIITKGADTNVLARLSDSDARTLEVKDRVVSTLGEMAVQGLRTLVVGTRVMSQSEYDTWNERFLEAGRAISDREHKVDQVCLEAETQLCLVGVTAIEDKLQDQVPETIRYFLEAGVIVWMLTGDKRETAVTIGATSKLVDPQKDFVQHVDVAAATPGREGHDVVREQLTHALHAAKGRKNRVTIVVDGITLSCIMDHVPELFLEVSQLVNSAILCRLTPLQKASIVGMFQRATGHTALAVGDGANDVSMIQEGKVGIGIIGLEGAQATLAADYAIPRFKHLKRLCMVHGRYALYRNALCVNYSFYKNICLALIQFYYAFYAGGSGQTLFDGWLLAFFNFAFTSVPPLCVGIFEKDVDESRLMSEPLLFKPLAAGLYFDARTISLWFLESVAHSLCLYFISLNIIQMEGVLVSVGTMLMTVLVYLVLLKLMLHIHHVTWIQFGGVLFGLVFYFIFIICYSSITHFFGSASFYFVTFRLLRSSYFWLYLAMFLLMLLVAIDLGLMAAQRHIQPTARDKAQKRFEEEKQQLMISKVLDGAMYFSS